MSQSATFAVVDVETTGVFPRRDRVVEVAIIRLDASGQVIEEYESLINPMRDLGPTWLHGVTARAVTNAPCFEDLSGDIVRLLRGAVVVGHNVGFDSLFLDSKFNRCGHQLPELPLLCTMRWGMEQGFGQCKLCELCEELRIQVGQMHSAMTDARCVAQILPTVLQELRTSDPDYLEVLAGSASAADPWPPARTRRKPYPRCTAEEDAAFEPFYIQNLLTRLPARSQRWQDPAGYALVLERALEDRRVTQDEADGLLELAMQLGLSREQAVQVHRVYMQSLVHIAQLDGVITAQGQEDLDQVRRLLGIEESELTSMLSEPPESHRSCALPTKMLVGTTVCFTGQLQTAEGTPISRSEVEALATGKGMIVLSRVTTTLDLLVTSDPDSMSGKAKKAREYGVRIMAGPVFWNMMRT